MHGNLGISLTTGQPVLAEIAARLPASAELTLLGLILAVLIAVPLGVLAALRQDSWIDHLCRVVTTAGVSLPVFFTGLLAVYVFYYVLGWAPAPLGRLDSFMSEPPQVTGFFLIDSLLARDWEAFMGALSQLILPAVTLARVRAGAAGAHHAGVHAGGPGVRVRAHGAGERADAADGGVTYAFRNALLPLLTTLGMVFSFLLGANVLVEKVFAWPGIGSYAVEALIASDFAPVQGFVLTMAILYILLNLAIDLLYGLVDPRMRAA